MPPFLGASTASAVPARARESPAASVNATFNLELFILIPPISSLFPSCGRLGRGVFEMHPLASDFRAGNQMGRLYLAQARHGLTASSDGHRATGMKHAAGRR